MKKIFIDTNFLLAIYQFKIDIFNEINRLILGSYELWVLDKSIDELKKVLVVQKGRDKKAAKLALSLIDRKKMNILNTNNKGYADDILAELASQTDNLIATQDTGLKKRIKDNKIITIRQKNHLIIM